MGNNKRIAIIGGGAAGLMVAATLVERQVGYEIHIFEKNKELGTKIRISGGGRCNVTTGYFKKQNLQYKYTRGRDFLSHAMSQFGPRKMAQRCELHGVPLTCEPDMRVFPQSNKSTDIVGIFEKIICRGNCNVHFDEGINTISTKMSGAIGIDSPFRAEGNESKESFQTKFILTTDKASYDFDYIIITTGGNAYAHTGSSGDGYELAKKLGHTITPLGPSLNSFLVQEEWVKTCSGISFQNACIKSGMQPVSTLEKSVSGPLLFTHFGISGPVTFSYSSQIPHIHISHQQPHTILIQPFADRNEQWRNTWLTQQALEQPKKQLTTILRQEFSDRWIQSFLEAHQFQGSTNIGNFPREQKKQLAKLLGHGIPLTLIARRPGDEFVTAGGVNTNEVNPETMESKLCPGLYFAGEVLNIDAVTGGFNFQSCWATGRCAGMAISN